MVGFYAAEFGSEWSECLGFDGAVGLFVGEAGGADERSPTVALGRGGDGLVLGGKLGDRAPLLLLGNDRLVRRELSSTVLQNAVEWIAPGRVEGLISPGVWRHACTEEASR